MMMNKQDRLDSLLRKAATGTTTVSEDRELAQLHEEKIRAKARTYEWDVVAIKAGKR